MTSDVNGTVVAIQGTAVSSTAPTDGQVLTYVSADSEWEPQTPTVTGLRQASFTSSGTWTAPSGVTNILVVGAGGGGGGGGGLSGGGGGSWQQTSYVSVSSGTTYTITIGAGGGGGSGHTSNGSDGSPTTMTHSGTTYFYAMGGGGASSTYGGNPFANAIPNSNTYLPGSGSTSTSSGLMNLVGGYSGGSPGSGPFEGGGGGAGPQGSGGNGGDGNTVAGNGSNGGANTGAGGGGGGYQNSPPYGNGTGGNGGSGYLYILY